LPDRIVGLDVKHLFVTSGNLRRNKSCFWKVEKRLVGKWSNKENLLDHRPHTKALSNVGIKSVVNTCKRFLPCFTSLSRALDPSLLTTDVWTNVRRMLFIRLCDRYGRFSSLQALHSTVCTKSKLRVFRVSIRRRRSHAVVLFLSLWSLSYAC
jgi:hypothetical protein